MPAAIVDEIRAFAQDYDENPALSDRDVTDLVEILAFQVEGAWRVNTLQAGAEYCYAMASFHSDTTPQRAAAALKQGQRLSGYLLGTGGYFPGDYVRSVPAPPIPTLRPSPTAVSEARVEEVVTQDIAEHDTGDMSHEDIRRQLSTLAAGEAADLLNYYTRAESNARFAPAGILDDHRDNDAQDALFATQDALAATNRRVGENTDAARANAVDLGGKADHNHTHTESDITDLDHDDETARAAAAAAQQTADNTGTALQRHIANHPTGGGMGQPYDDTAIRNRLSAIEADDWVTGRRIRSREIGGGHLGDNILESRHVPTGTVDQRMLADDSVGQAELRGDSVGEAELTAALRAKVNEPRDPPAIRTGDGLEGDGSAANPLEIRYDDDDFGVRNTAPQGQPPVGEFGLSNARRGQIDGAATAAALGQERTQRQAGDIAERAALNTHAGGLHITAAERAKEAKYPASIGDGQVLGYSQARDVFLGVNPTTTVAPSIESILLPAKSTRNTARRATATLQWTIAEIRTVEADFVAPTGDYILSARLSDRSEFTVEHVEWDEANSRVEVTIRNINGANPDRYTGRVTLNVLRGTASPSGGLTEDQVDARIEQEVAPQALRGNADGWPGTKTFDGLFKDAGQEDLPGASATIGFNVDAEVQDTEAAGTSFNLTAQQANEPGAYLTAKYALTGISSLGDLPSDLELLLQVRDTGAILDRHNLKIIASGGEEGHVHFDNLGDAGAKRWAIRIGDGHGGYEGSIQISEVQYHAGQPLADDAVLRIVAPELHTEKEERQRVEADLANEIDEAKAIVAITDALPQPANIQRKTGIVWRQDIPYEQAASDALQAPATGFVQVILGNLGATPIMPVEYCVNRKEIIYALGTGANAHEISIKWDAQRRAIIRALGPNNTLSPLGRDDIATTTTGLVMIEYHRARRGGTDAGSPSWERVLGLQDSLQSSRDLNVRRPLGTVSFPRADVPQVWEIAAIAEIHQNDEDDDIRQFQGHLSFTGAGADVHRQGGDRIGNGVGTQYLMVHYYAPGPGGDDDVWRVTEDSNTLQRVFLASGAGDVTMYLWAGMIGAMRNLRVFTRVVA